MRGVRLAALVALGLAVFAAGAWRYATRWHPAADAYPVQGIDVSAANGAVDWPTVAARGADFAYVRATDGTRRDAAFEVNWAAVADSGIRRGAAHRFSLCRPAAAQARAFITTVPRYRDALPGVLDLDFDPACPARPDRAAALGAVRAFLDAAEHHLAEPMLLRVSPAFEDEYRVSEAVDRPYWAVRDFLVPDYLARPWRMWQASAIRRIDGIEGPINWNVVAP